MGILLRRFNGKNNQKKCVWCGRIITIGKFHIDRLQMNHILHLAICIEQLVIPVHVCVCVPARKFMYTIM